MLGGPLFQKYGVYLDRVTVAQPPYEYESRLQGDVSWSISKLAPDGTLIHTIWRLPSSNATSSETEATCDTWLVPFLFDLELLRHRYQQELRPYLGNPKREDLTLQLWIEAIEEDRAD